MIASEAPTGAGQQFGSDEEIDSGRSAPIDEDVEGELNAALPEPAEENESSPSSS